MTRPARDVIQDHLDRRSRHDLEGDLDHNYAEDIVVLSKDGVFHGKDGIRATAATLRKWLPDAEYSYSYDVVRVDGEFALLSWSAKADNGSGTCDGADSFVIRDGRIVAQTIHYDIRSD